MTTRTLGLSVALLMILAVPGRGGPHADRKGPVAENFKVIGHLRIDGRTPEGDVLFFDHGGKTGKHVYMGAFRDPCTGKGVSVIDVNDPEHPRFVAEVRTRFGVSNEDISVVTIGKLDVLVIGVQSCNRGREGLGLYDVTHPDRPTEIGFLGMDGVHELDVVSRPDGRVLALLATPYTENEELIWHESGGGDFKIVDISNPRKPQRLADWGVVEDSGIRVPGADREIQLPGEGIGNFSWHYAHSARSADDGMTAYVSYWDSGVLKFDISNPRRPKLIARTAYSVSDEGDAHSMAPYEIDGERYLLQNDEDLTTVSTVEVTTSVSGETIFPAIQETYVPTLLSDAGELSDEVLDAGNGCEADDFLLAAEKVALFDAAAEFYKTGEPGGECGLKRQLRNALQAQPSAILINLVGNARPSPRSFGRGFVDEMEDLAVGVPVMTMTDNDGAAAAIRADLGVLPITVTLTPLPSAWGSLRVFRESAPEPAEGGDVPTFVQVGRFDDLPHVVGDEVDLRPQTRHEAHALPETSLWWSVHNTEVLGSRSYSSWYAHGIVALDLSDPTAPEFVGQFIPPPSDRRGAVLGSGKGAMVWGLSVDETTGLIYVSDMKTGLWVIRPTGPAAP